MAKTIFILGAGASREGGAPVMRDFPDRASDIWALADLDLACPRPIEGTRAGEKQTIEEVAWPGSSDAHNYQ